MKSRLTPYYISLVYEACLKSFWRKSALRNFLRECRISDNFLATWSEDGTKRNFLDRLFEKLPSTDNGRLALLKMAKFLMEQRTFPDLLNWEDSQEKIKAAHDAVTRLRVYHQQQEEQIESEEQSKKSREQLWQFQTQEYSGRENARSKNEGE